MVNFLSQYLSPEKFFYDYVLQLAVFNTNTWFVTLP